MNASAKSTTLIEVDLLIRAIYEKYGFDFSNYSKASFTRRIKNFVELNKISSIGELIHQVINDENLFHKLVEAISVTVTEMFRDPQVYVDIKEKIIPYLRTFPTLNIWHAGCATGQEVYSLAILLHEENLLDKVQIYATDINKNSLEIAKAGIYSNEDIKRSISNYLSFHGKNSFSDYYRTRYDNSIFAKYLKENITFLEHNLTTDEDFNQMHLVLCRNVLIYFNTELQKRVIKLFSKSLIKNGFLCLGLKESLMLLDTENEFTAISQQNKIFQKIK